MELKQFKQDLIQVVENFAADYEQGRKRKGLTMIRPVEQWMELFDDYLEQHSDFAGIRG